MVLRKKPAIAKFKSKLAIEHSGFFPYLQHYMESMKIKGYAEMTLHRRDSCLRAFIAWCDDRSLEHPNQITKPILESYQRHLFYLRSDNGRSLSPSTQNNYLTGIKQFFKWLTRQNHLLYNPASEMEIIKSRPSLPAVLSVEEVERLLAIPETDTPDGLRDRAILELFYSTGLRRGELCQLQVSDLSLERKTLYVQKGKGSKDRVVPVGERALHWLARYLDEVRELLLASMIESALFIDNYGSAFRDGALGDRVKRLMKQAGLEVTGSCHLLRHAMATHMLENGADIRIIQAILGHADLNTTQLYTHVSIRQLQAVHAETHPARLRQDAANANEISKEALLSLLAEEQEEEADSE